MSTTIKLTAKRQLTFSKELCEEMHLKPGDTIQLDKCHVNGAVVFCMIPKREDNRHEWVGSLKTYTKGKSHNMEDIRRSIGNAIGREHAD